MFGGWSRWETYGYSSETRSGGMAFDSRWEREHSTLRSQIKMLDGLDAPIRPRAVRSPGSRSQVNLWNRLAAGLRHLSGQIRTLLA